MKTRLLRLVTVLIGVATLCMLVQSAIAAEVPRMTKEELKSRLDDPDVVIVDVRIGKDWKGSEFKIKGAVREDPTDFSSWADKYPKGKTLVLYCA
jgi:rhodanese-related sulfurtransferase